MVLRLCKGAGRGGAHELRDPEARVESPSCRDPRTAAKAEADATEAAWDVEWSINALKVKVSAVCFNWARGRRERTVAMLTLEEAKENHAAPFWFSDDKLSKQ